MFAFSTAFGLCALRSFIVNGFTVKPTFYTQISYVSLTKACH
ncbi:MULTISPECIES: hypothetical protein [Undibacterium]|nr:MULTISPECIES: hypothetical protein [Undibacterium]